MATVRISDKLIESVVSNAKRTFRVRLDKAKDDQPDIAKTVYDLSYGKLLNNIDHIHKQFFKKHTRFNVSSVRGTRWRDFMETLGVPTISAGYASLPKDIVYRPAGDDLLICPDSSLPVEVTGFECSSYSTYDASLNSDDPRWSETVMPAIEQYYEKYTLIEKERDMFVSSVEKLLRANTSLAPALRAFPALWDLLDSEYQERHKKQVARKKPENKLDPSVDLGKLNAVMAKVKLTGGA